MFPAAVFGTGSFMGKTMQYHEKIFWLAVNAYHEARGEPFSGQKAVCHVVLNRASLRKQTVKEVILAPFQFSWHNGGIFPPIDDYPSQKVCGRLPKLGIIYSSRVGKAWERLSHKMVKISKMCTFLCIFWVLMTFDKTGILLLSI